MNKETRIIGSRGRISSGRESGSQSECGEFESRRLQLTCVWAPIGAFCYLGFNSFGVIETLLSSLFFLLFNKLLETQKSVFLIA